ncbi:MAG: hypothetical protein USCGTAYLOR_02122 [Chromatiales bacterium USCg_Taylor]|nr:MAG: hypothetical protein USCGTAYLOR_02122 [Chromatiales bacterium USCg_Taylor]
MGILDWILGSDKAPKQGQATQQEGQPPDEQAIARYRYLLKTAPPETIEQAHAEAFARLTPEQRRMALQQLSASVPEAERAAVAPGGADPQALARMATRAEVRQPGTMEQTFGRMGGGVGLGGLMAGSFLSTIAGTVIGSMIAQQFFSHEIGFDGGGVDSGHPSGADENQDAGDNGFDDASGEMDADDFGDV